MSNTTEFWNRIPLRASSGKTQTTCPECSHTRKKKTDKCLSVDIESGHYHCSHCGIDGWGYENDYKKPEPVELPKLNTTELSEKTFKYLTEERMLSSVTIKRNGITEGEHYMPQVQKKRNCIWFNYYVEGVHVNTKYRDGQKNFTQVKGAPKHFYKIDDIIGSDYAIVTEGECYSRDTEVLTRSGWINISEWDGQEVMTYLKDGSGVYGKPKTLVKKEYSGEMIEVSNLQRFAAKTTINHSWVMYKDGVLHKRKYSDFPSNYMIPRTLKFNGAGLDMSDDEIKAYIAISADFTIRDKGDLYGVFKKKRKVERITGILDRLGVKYSNNIDGRGYNSIFIRRQHGLKVSKLFDFNMLGLMSSRQLNLFIEELVHWDGNSVKNRNQTEYSSKHKHNAKFVQTLSHMCGYVSTIMHRKNKFGEWYKVSILFNKRYTSNQKPKVEVFETIETVYCLTVDSGMLLTRYKDCISINGNCDALTWEEAGHKAAVSVPDGALQPNAKYSAKKLEYIDNDIEYFDQVKKVYISTDNDPPGLALRKELSRRFGRDRCWIIDLQEYKDANEVLQKLGRVDGVEFLQQAYKSATQYPIEGSLTVDDIFDTVMELYENGMDTGNKIGYTELDEHIKWLRGWFYLITGIPSHGKSTFFDNILVRLVNKFGWKFAIYSPEHPPEMHIQRLASQLIGKPFNKGFYDRMDRAELEAAMNVLRKHIYFIRPTDDDFTLDNILQIGKEHVNRYGIDALIIDPWNTLESIVPAGMNETQHTSKMLDKVNRFKQANDCSVIVVAHPTKMQRDDKGDYKVPLGYSISGSANFYNKCDFGITVYRDFKKNHTEAHIWKVKFEGLIGKQGQCNFTYQPKDSTYIEISEKPHEQKVDEQWYQDEPF